MGVSTSGFIYIHKERKIKWKVQLMFGSDIVVRKSIFYDLVIAVLVSDRYTAIYIPCEYPLKLQSNILEYLVYSTLQ